MMICATPGQPGTLDATWGPMSPLGPGKVLTNFDVSNGANTIALQPDGKVILAGGCYSSQISGFCALRYNNDGSLDASFGSNGTVSSNFGSAANAIAVQPNGKLLLIGACFNGSNDDFCAIRYHPNGLIDTSFGVDGKVVTAIGGASDQAVKIALQADGKAVVVGRCDNGSNIDFCAARYYPDGSLDLGFGTDGKVITTVGSHHDEVQAIAIQPDGKMLLAGHCGGNGSYDFCAVRYDVSGSLDASFGINGKVITVIAQDSYNIAWAMALQPDGKILLAGGCAKFCALRYNADGYS